MSFPFRHGALAPSVAFVFLVVCLNACATDAEESAEPVSTGSEPVGSTSLTWSSDPPGTDTTLSVPTSSPVDTNPGHVSGGDSSTSLVSLDCRVREDCDPGERCQDGVCEAAGAIPCTVDGECARDWRCGRDGRCLVCEEGRDCAPGLRCVQRECQVVDLPEVIFAQRTPEGLGDLSVTPRFDDETGYGPGAAFVDIDGSGRLDLFFGANSVDDSRPCLYRNVSEPGRLAFAPIEALCSGELDGAIWGLALPTEESLREELLVFGTSFARHLRKVDEGSFVMETIFEDPISEDVDPETICTPGSALAVDLTLDGRLEVLVGCQANQFSNLGSSESLFADNRILVLGENGYELAPIGTFDELRDAGSTLGLGWVELEAPGLGAPGLGQLVVANDTFSTVFFRNQQLPPGGLLRRCAPSESCVWESFPLGEGSAAWGSYMGVGQVRVQGVDHVYLSDWGPNRLFRFADGQLEDRAMDLGIALDQREGMRLFSWGVVVDDFNFSGRDDLFVTNGIIPGSGGSSIEVHYDVLFVQREEGGFVELSTEVGFEPFAFDPERPEDPGTSSRAAARVDLDGSGRLLLLVLNALRPPEFFVERVPREAPLRCTLVPRPRMAPGAGVGYALASADAPEDFRVRDVQGQLRLGLPLRILSAYQRGYLRFPSGATIPFDCAGRPGPIVVEEPEWAIVEGRGASVRVELRAPWLAEGEEEVEVSLHFLRSDPSDPMRLQGLGRVDHSAAPSEVISLTRARPNAADALLLEINGRFLPRRFPL